MTSYVKSVFSIVSSAFDLNAATLSGAMDIIVFEDENGDMQTTPWHVRFGKLRLLKSREKGVKVAINGELRPEIRMKLGSAGEAYFIEEADEKPPDELCPSPASMPSSPKLLAYDDQGARTGGESMSGTDTKGENMQVSDSYAISYMSDSEVDNYRRVGPIPRAKSVDVLEGELQSNLVSDGKWSVDEETSKAVDQLKALDEASKVTAIGVESAVQEVVSAVVENAAYDGEPPQLDETALQEEDSPLKGSCRIATEPPNMPMEELSLPPSIATLQKMEEEIAKKQGQNGNLVTNIAENDNEEISESSHMRSYNFESVGQSGEHNNLDNGEFSYGENSRSETGFDNRLLSLSLCGHLINAEMDEAKITEVFDQHKINFDEFQNSPSVLNDPKLLLRLGDNILPWEEAAQVLVSMLAFGNPIDIEHSRLKEPGLGDSSNDKNQALGSPFHRIFGLSGKKSDIQMAREANLNAPALPAPETENLRMRKKHVRKSLRPPNELLRRLKLNPGRNKIRFIVYSSLQGRQEVESNIYLWSSDQKIVISDVDGTITKSDVLGHLLPRMGRDWSHTGVANLFHKLISMGYNIMYLTSRPIGQAATTRAYLGNLVQGEVGLPQGPVVMSPDRLIRSFTREVILRKPHEFKIAALRDIRLMFPPDFNPFYAGFGNRDTDVISYGAVGIPPQRIFTINPKGDLKVMNANYEACGSYSDLQNFVRSVFPDIKGYHGQKSINEMLVNQEYNTFNYWKPQLPEVDITSLM